MHISEEEKSRQKHSIMSTPSIQLIQSTQENVTMQQIMSNITSQKERVKALEENIKELSNKSNIYYNDTITPVEMDEVTKQTHRYITLVVKYNSNEKIAMVNNFLLPLDVFSPCSVVKTREDKITAIVQNCTDVLLREFFLTHHPNMNDDKINAVYASYKSENIKSYKLAVIIEFIRNLKLVGFDDERNKYISQMTLKFHGSERIKLLPSYLNNIIEKFIRHKNHSKRITFTVVLK